MSDRTANIADEFVMVRPGGVMPSALRAIVRVRPTPSRQRSRASRRTGLIRVADLCLNAKFRAVYFGLSSPCSGKKNVRMPSKLVTELNRHTKFTISFMRGHYRLGSNEVYG